MRIVAGAMSLIVAGLLVTTNCADEIKSGKFGGAFNVTVITGKLKGKTLCYL